MLSKFSRISTVIQRRSSTVLRIPIVRARRNVPIIIYYVYLFVYLHVIKLISIYNFVQPIAERANSSEFATRQCQFFRGSGKYARKNTACRIRSSSRARKNETRYKCKTLRLRYKMSKHGLTK